ncbi:MAG: DUF6884 domain-containing protein [Luteolibacter sp.]
MKRTLYLVSCVAGKQAQSSAAKDLYTSAWFKKARAFVEKHDGQWRILSAEHGLVHPDTEIAPYERTLNNMGVRDRKVWAGEVIKHLLPLLKEFDRVVIVAGKRYREFLLADIRSKVKSIQIPMEGLPIGKQLAWFKNELTKPIKTEKSRRRDLERFYDLLALLENQLGGRRLLCDCSSSNGWPTRGIYFFFESSEGRTDSGTGPRIVRVGTHGLKTGSKSPLWKRLAQHQGVQSSGSGNHRGSIFRLLIGQALIDRDKLAISTWGAGSSISAAGKRQSLSREVVKELELPLEQEVSNFIGNMPFLWLDIDDDPSPDSLRGYIERNSIALLSNYDRSSLDCFSQNWLGNHSNREKVRRSGLWNSNHVDEAYDPGFLDILEHLIASM